MASHEPQSDTSKRTAQPSLVVERIEAALHGLQFGTVTVVVQDGVVVQVERTEKFRLRSR